MEKSNMSLNKSKWKYLKTNGNEKITTQNLCDALKAMLRGNLITIYEAYLKK